MRNLKEILEKIEILIAEKDIDMSKIKDLHIDFIKNKLKNQHCINNFIGDFPTFIEPVHLKSNVKIGDDVLIGPNVYVGENCIIGDYGEIINTIIFDNVEIGENFKLENCIIAKNSKLTFSNFKAFDCILKGQSNSLENVEKFSL